MFDSLEFMSYKYSDYYNSYKEAQYWRDVKEVSGNSVNSGTAPGRAVWNASGTYGPGIVSESMGYAMMLAALYDDKETFDQLSATVQAAIEESTKPLMPWYLITITESQPNEFKIADNNSASDGDINIALAYVYADQAASVYDWDDSTSNNELYYTLAKDYIAAIRQYDFSQKDSEANNHIIQDGFKQAINGFSSENWHPDYSDLRAYQLFKLYDTTGATFWDQAQDYTKEAWKAVFNFGANDTGRSENAAKGLINASSRYVKISNPTYGNLEASDLYTGFTFNRQDDKYNADSSRLPMRILNYINAEENTGDTEIIGVANANLSALNQAFQGPKNEFYYITDTVNIAPPYSTGSGYTQNFTAAGLLALAGSKHLSVAGTQETVENLNTEFGTNGINGANVSSSGGWAIGNDLTRDDVFNDALTLWGLTTYEAGNTNLLDQVNSIKSFDSITGNLMLGETGKEDVFVFSKGYFRTKGNDNLQERGMVRIVGFNRKEDELLFEAGKMTGRVRTKIRRFVTDSKANKLINKDKPFILDRRTGELYATFIGSNSDSFTDLTPIAKFLEKESSFANIKADLF
jgi:hypothetical protein